MNAIDKYFVRHGGVNQLDIVVFKSYWEVSFATERWELAKHRDNDLFFKYICVDALRDLRNKIDTAIKEIENDKS